jgi:hypothetical protein
METNMAYAEVTEALGGGYIALVRGFQIGGEIDPALGCGTAVYQSRREAWNAIQAYCAPTPFCAECGEYWPCSDSKRTDIRGDIRARHYVASSAPRAEARS